MPKNVIRIEGIIGAATDPTLHDAVHRMEHAGRVEYLTVGPDDMLRRRLRMVTDQGTDCAIALCREERLFHEAVLLLDSERAIVVRLEEASWLAVEPLDAAAAVKLGYCAGNMHWRVVFVGSVLRIALNGPKADYLARLAPLFSAGRIREVASDG